MSYLEDIRNDIKAFGEKLYSNPNATDDSSSWGMQRK